MPDPASTSLQTWLTAAVFILISCAVYGTLLRRLAREGGRVLVDQLDLPELLMSLVFAGFFTMFSVLAVRRHEREATTINIDAVVPNSLIFIIFVVGISGFLRFRGLPLRRTFGLDRVSPLAVLGWACGLILATFPLSFAAGAITSFFITPEPQPLVDLFNKVARHHDYSAIGKILLSAVVIQPACEEFLFRGFFYGVWKRYLGPWGAGFCACLLFAAFHTSLSAFTGLFFLAVCLNIAYERTGSLFVPIGMHALFNLTSLLVIYGQAQLSAGQ